MDAQQISTRLGLLISEQHEARLASKAHAAEDKTKNPKKFFDISLLLLLHLTSAVMSNELPTIWASIVSCTKVQQCGVIQ